jgi:hypothetical protein
VSKFDGCWQRIKRADTQDNALARAWNRFIKSDPYSVSVNVYYGGTGRIAVRPKKPFPPSFALYLGEILYHLRAALDESVYRAIVLETGKDPPPNKHHLTFPICPLESDFPNASRYIEPLPDKLRSIIEAVQPYKIPKLPPELMVLNVNRALSILHRWARNDRHRRLHVIASWASGARPKICLPEGISLAEVTITGDGFLENEREIARFRLAGFTPGANVQANPDLMLDIAVDESPPPCADNDTLGQRLLAMSASVKTVVRAFEDYYFPEVKR